MGARTHLIDLMGGPAIAVDWLWDDFVIALTLVAVAAVAFIGALTLGWNSPRPHGPPDWEAGRLPRSVEVRPDARYVSLLGHESSDFTLEALVAPLQGPTSGFYDYGLLYRAQDVENYYIFAVGADGYYGVMRVEGATVTALTVWQQFPHIKRGSQLNRLLVSCAGAVCTFRVNDEFVATVEDDRWLSGDAGLWARSSEEVTLQFESVRMWVLPR